MTILAVCALLAFAGALLMTVATLLVLRERPGGTAPTPPVSILRPLKGAEPDLAENLESFYRLDYPEYEIVLSFASPTDPAVEPARRVADAHPNVPTAFVFDSREPGANPKVSRLIHAMTRARHAVLLISDADVRARPEFLRETVAELADPSVGLVSNPFRAAGSGSLGSAIESLHFNAFVFGGTAAVSRIARRPCVVGKSILLRREVLDWIGGLDAVRDFLAEDYLLGDIVSKAGFRVALSRHVLTVTSVGKSVRQFWDRQVRWARMRRRLGGIAFATEAFASPVPWALFLLGGRFFFLGAAILLGKIALDATTIRRLGFRPRLSDLGLIVLKDALFFGVFWAALASNKTHWRGKAVEIGSRTLLRV